MIKIYLIGPLTPRSVRQNHAVEYLNNVRQMLRVAVHLIHSGFAPYCPGMDFAYQLGGDAPLVESQFKSCSLAWLEVCDGVLLLDGYSDSSGCIAELECAKEHKIPVFSCLSDLIEFYGGKANADPTA